MINRQALLLFLVAIVGLSVLAFVLKVPTAVLSLVTVIALLAQTLAPALLRSTQRNSDRPPPPPPPDRN